MGVLEASWKDTVNTEVRKAGSECRLLSVSTKSAKNGVQSRPISALSSWQEFHLCVEERQWAPLARKRHLMRTEVLSVGFAPETPKSSKA